MSKTPTFSTIVLRIEDDGYNSMPGITVSVCSACGAFVEDTGVHAVWHEEQP